jgi:membrane-associated phospholipid phosphatase
LLAGMVALVGASRVYLGHHFTSDVLVSYLLGTSYLVCLTSFYQRARKRTKSQ